MRSSDCTFTHGFRVTNQSGLQAHNPLSDTFSGPSVRQTIKP